MQKRVLAAIRSLRHPGSHVAGSLPLYTPEDSVRESQDIDLFHDAMAVMHAACAADLDALSQAGFTIQRGSAWSETFRRALVEETGSADAVEIDWAVDATWRFFPPVQDAILGWRLHDMDLACNKALALAGRSETRDLVDILIWSRRLDLAAILWAACGKDPGYTPLSLLEQMRRSARIDPSQLAMLKARELDPLRIKQDWLSAADAAEAAITNLADALPDLETGVLFLGDGGHARWPVPDRPLAEQGLTVHRPSIGGCVPIIHMATKSPSDPIGS
jgi:hypothetical protein